MSCLIAIAKVSLGTPRRILILQVRTLDLLHLRQTTFRYGAFTLDRVELFLLSCPPSFIAVIDVLPDLRTTRKKLKRPCRK